MFKYFCSLRVYRQILLINTFVVRRIRILARNKVILEGNKVLTTIYTQLRFPKMRNNQVLISIEYIRNVS